ncbi:MAG: hypothetical protein IGS39_13925 [Calothrix sp. C42_A2020_038]|nr:hypothetical protein [Calothrix sp. C42_A2020_038]
MHLKYKLLAIAALSIAVTQTITPAKALSGQSVKSFVRWVHSRPVVALKQNKVYTKHGYKRDLRNYMAMIPTDDNHSRKSLKAHKDTTVRFSEYNEKALKLMLKIYDSHSSDSFKNPRGQDYRRGVRKTHN